MLGLFGLKIPDDTHSERMNALKTWIHGGCHSFDRQSTPPKRLEEWLRAAEEDMFLEDHEEDEVYA
jgi:hypothetical protein